MADKMMRIAGRTTGGTAKALLVESNGEPVVVREWAETDTKIFDVEIRDTSGHKNITEGTVLNVSIYPVNSLRVRNTTGKSITIRFLNDLNTNNTAYLVVDNATAKIDLSASNHNYQIFTPQDFPFLNYLHYLKIEVVAAETPTAGSVVVYHCGRK